MRTLWRGLRLLSTAVILSAVASTPVFAQRGRPIDGASADLFETLDSSVTCFFNPLVDQPIPGRLVRRNGRTLFQSYRAIRDKELQRILAKGRIRSEKDPRFKFRRKKLTDPLKEGRSACIDALEVRDAVRAALRNAVTSTDASLDDFLTLVTENLAEASDPIEEYIRTLTNILKSFKTRSDFDALASLTSRAGSFFQIEAPDDDDFQVTPSECPAESETVLYHVPGVNDTPFASLTSTVLVREMATRASSTEAAKIAFRHLFNRTGLPANGGAEVCRLFVGISGDSLPTGDGSGVDSLPASYQGLAQAYEDALSRCLTAYGASSSQSLTDFVQSVASFDPSDTEISTFKDLVTQDVQSGRRVIVLAHSQGNILAKRTLDILGTDGTSFKLAVALISVASPIDQATSSTFGGFGAYTLANDVVLQVPGAIPANTSNTLSGTSGIDPATHRFAVHDFVTGYFADSGTRELILDEVFGQQTAVANGRQLIGQGYFQVTLTWDIPGDIDLHVFEPTGAHVFYASKIGSVGRLDVDDIPGDGPENYFVCARSRLIEGDYRVEVNNYNGTTGTLATIAIRAGNQRRTYNVTMDPANQGDSNLSVTTVTYSGGGRFSLP